MPTSEVLIERARIVVSVAVSVPGSNDEHYVEALLDTGADTIW